MTGPGNGVPSSTKTTIVALSSGLPPAGVAVIRVSGPQTREVVSRLAGGMPEARRASVRWIRHPATGEKLDRGLVLFFAGPDSFTGEDVGELHVHGGRAVVTTVLSAAMAIDGVRLAEAGEFTRRAFLSGRVDLTEAEGLADLVAAETEMQRRLALQQADGSVRSRYDNWRDRLLRSRGLIEAEIDFGDEDGVAGAWSAGARAELAALAAEMRAALGERRAETIRSGAEIVILGPPNSGKSSLLNALAGRDVAIVSSEAGTTRDIIEVAVDLGGYRARLTDTAGLRDTESAAEREGVSRARQRAGIADLVLWLWDDASDASKTAQSPAPVWVIASKADQMDSAAERRARLLSRHVVSSITGAGLDALVEDIRGFLAGWLGKGEDAAITTARHRTALGEAVERIETALAATESEVVAEYLRQATDQLGRVTGHVDVEEVLGVVFRSFCIGK